MTDTSSPRVATRPERMRGQFFGALWRAGPGPVASKEAEPAEVKRFAGGYIVHDAGSSVYQSEDEICLAFGAPRFGGERLAAGTAAGNPAEAWAEAFRKHGLEAPAGVRGRFAAVLLRRSERAVVAATDRFGTWPVCYSASADSLTIGQRADDVAGTTAAISAQAIFNYLFFHVIPAPFTIFEHVSRLPAAHTLEWRNGELTCRPYWCPRFSGEAAKSLEDSEHEFLEIVEAGVAHESADRETGAYLSGGTDSSTVAGMLGKVTGRPARTYSIGFDAEGYDEMDYARIAAQHFGTEHHEHYLTPDDLVQGISRIARHYEQPFGNSSAVPAWFCADRAREDGIEKLLAGDGGDELFAGNTRYAKQLVFDRYRLLPASIRKIFLEPLTVIPGIDRAPVLRKIASYVKQARVPMPERLQSYNMLLRIGTGTVFEADFLAAVDAECPFAMQRDTWNAIETRSLVNHMLAFEWKYTLSDNDLPKVIGTADMADVEVGFPLLSDELVDFSLRVPPEWKLRGQTLRWFFKHALRDFLPETILTKPKHGFGLPFGVWTSSHSGLSALAKDSLDSLAQRGVVRPEFIKNLMSNYFPAHPGYYGEMVWILMMLELWFRQRSLDWRFQG